MESIQLSDSEPNIVGKKSLKEIENTLANAII